MLRLPAVLSGGLLAGALLLAGTSLVAGCSADDEPAPRRTPDALRLDASVTQFRFDEGTNDLRAGITNQGRGTVRVSQATIGWDGFAFSTVPIPDGMLAPGETAAFAIQYGAPQCAHPPQAGPRLVAVVDGRSRSLPQREDEDREQGAAHPATL